jgi:hypothetical protein
MATRTRIRTSQGYQSGGQMDAESFGAAAAGYRQVWFHCRGMDAYAGFVGDTKYAIGSFRARGPFGGATR